MNTVNQFFAQIYKWMAVGVLLSAFSAYLTMTTSLAGVLQNPVIFYGMVAIQIGICLGMQWMINRISPAMAFNLYLVYALLNGVVMSGLLAFYLTQSASTVLVVFISAASMFALLAFIGFTTKKDISGWGTFLIAGMWGVFFSSILNIFLQNSVFDIIISAVALLVFAGLTVYDNQYYKNLFVHLHSEDEKNKAVTLGALHMYINFIMIFQSLLRLVNSR